MWWLALLACGEDDPAPCEGGVPTCDSSLIVELPDPRTEFSLQVSDDLGLEVSITCPSETNPYTVGEVSLACGAGSVMLYQSYPFGDEVTVQLEDSAPQVFQPRWEIGPDLCGNGCNLGNIQL